jgi:hypothetical protein
LFRVSDFACTVVALAESAAALAPIGVAMGVLPARVDHVLLSFLHAGRLVGLKAP